MKPYPAYKDSGVEWIGAVPETWEVRKLKLLAEVNLSNVDKKSKEDEQPVRLCNYVDVYYNEKITPYLDFMVATARQDQIKTFSLEKGDVLITKDSESADDIAVPAFVSETLPEVVCGYHLAHIRPHKKNAVGSYLARAFVSSGIRDQFEVSANGITRFGIGKDTILNSLFPRPPLNEQTAIAAYLDRKTAHIDTLIERKRRLIDLLQEERTAAISHAVTKGLNPDVPMKDSGVAWIGEIPAGWEAVQLRYACDINYGITLQLDNQKRDGIRILTVRNITIDGDINLEQEFYIDEEFVEPTDILKKGDLLFNWRNGSVSHVGKTAYFDLDGTYAHVSFLLRIRCYKQLDSFFLKNYLQALRYTGFFTGTKDQVNRTFNSSELNCLYVIIPPIEEQIAIAAYLDRKTTQIDQTIDRTRRQIALLQEYRTALISAAVTGKIDVREEGSV